MHRHPIVSRQSFPLSPRFALRSTRASGDEIKCCRQQVVSRARAGWTLIEMLVTISVMSVLTGVAIKTLSSVLIAERNGVQHVVDLATVSRLARQFRQDVHGASAVEINSDAPGKPLLQVTIAEGHQVDYQIQTPGLLRTERRPDQSVRNELWRLKQTQFQCLATTGSPQMVTLVIAPQQSDKTVGKPRTTMNEVRIDAIRGRDRPPAR